VAATRSLTPLPQLAEQTARDKACTKCGATKPLTEFRPNRRMRDGRSSWCSDCHVAATRAWREANPGKVEAYNEARRKWPIGMRYRRCVECGGPFYVERRIDNARVCSEKCRRQLRKRSAVDVLTN
jgi:hypothetical protein